MLLVFGVLKWSLVAALEIAGVVLLILGLGVQIGSLSFRGLEVAGVPAGVVVMAAGVALAHFWTIRKKEIVEGPEAGESGPHYLGTPKRVETEYQVSIDKDHGNVQL
jgi:hypothetical protein